MRKQNQTKNTITCRLAKSHAAYFTVFAALAAFITYFSMYAFRKPFSAGIYSGFELFEMNYKTVLILSQVLGYMCSKFIGIRVISSMHPKSRIWVLISFIGIAELFLLLFAFFPYPYGFIFLFFNGLPLGMIWGIVFSYLEGRSVTEILAAGLSASFIVSSGIVKSVGKWLILTFHTSEFWMPFLTGLLFLPLFLIGAWMLAKLPPPSLKEIKARNLREPMSASDRKKMTKEIGVALLLLIVVYCFLTAYRDFRDNFAADMWNELGYTQSSNVFTLTEIPIALFVLAALGILYRIKENGKAVYLNYIIISLGTILIGLSTILFNTHIIAPYLWAILTGTGVYLAYVPFNSILFERIVALLRFKSNAGFLIYLADSFGYLGSIAILLFKNFYASNISTYKFLMGIGLYIAPITVVLMLGSLFLFRKKMQTVKMPVLNPGYTK